MAKRMTLKTLRETAIVNLTRSQLRSAYTVYRDVMQKRINRLAEGTATQRAYAAPFLSGGSKELKTLSQIDALKRTGWTENQLRREMEMRVRELQILEKSERTSLSGWKAIENRTVKALQAAGYKNITKGNLGAFGDYMEKMRAAFGNKIFPSEEAAEIFNTALDESDDIDAGELFNRLTDMIGSSYGVDLFL